MGRSNSLAILMICVAMALTTMSEALVKLLSSGMPTSQTLALRATLICLFLLPVVALNLRTFASVVKHPIVIGRAVIDGLASYLYFVALAYIPLPTATALFLTTPLMTTVVAACLGRGKVHWQIWIALISGFVGVLLILNPSVEGFNAYGVLVLLSAAITVVRDLCTSRIPTGVPSSHVLLLSVFCMGVFGYALSLGDIWVEPSGHQWQLVVIAALSFSVAGFTTIQGFRLGDIMVITPFRYTVIVWSTVLGFVIWGYVVSQLAMVGILVIVASALSVLRLNQARKADAVPSVVP